LSQSAPSEKSLDPERWTIDRRGAALAFVAVAACGGSHSPGFDSVDPSVNDAGSSSGGGTQPSMPSNPDRDAEGTSSNSVFTSSDAAGLGEGSADDGCPEAAKLVYVTGPGSQLWSFYPPTLKFTLIGTMSCLDSPTHMTIDRQGSAWVVSAGNLYKASTADASCAAVPTWTPQNAFSDFALTFLGTTNATDDTLYMLGSNATATGGQTGGPLGTFNVATGAVTVVGQVQVPSALGDMTTNGDGTLYYLMDSNAPTLYEINPSSGAVLSSSAIGAPGGGDQALAFWGGSFYAFEDDVIYQYDVKAATTMSLGNAPLSVTGAGQSTCVPTLPPISK
jgi:hypothetical protein